MVIFINNNDDATHFIYLWKMGTHCKNAYFESHVMKSAFRWLRTHITLHASLQTTFRLMKVFDENSLCDGDRKREFYFKVPKYSLALYSTGASILNVQLQKEAK